MTIYSVTSLQPMYTEQGLCNGIMSVRPSLPATDSKTAAGGFAAERQTGRRYRSPAAGFLQQAPPLSSKRVTVTDGVGSTQTCLCLKVRVKLRDLNAFSLVDRNGPRRIRMSLAGLEGNHC